MPDLVRSDLMAMGKTFSDAAGGGRQGDEERVEQSEQEESGVVLLLVVGAVVAVPAGEGRRRASCWQRSVREMSFSLRRWCLWRTR